MAKDALEGKTTKTEKVVEKVEKTIEAQKDYSKLTVAELKDLCEEKNIDTTGMKKADLISALEK
ncbi:MAG: SAP domain-containing protein [bacterium]|nr:SAP domain-containing protein [bacterium]